MFNVVEVIELCHPLGSDTELADRLWAAQQQHSQQRMLTKVERQCLIEHLSISNGSAAMGWQDKADEPLSLQLVERRYYGFLVVVNHWVSVGCLVAGGHEGHDGEWVLLGRCELLLHQRTEHPCSLCAQHHGKRAYVPGVRCPDPHSPYSALMSSLRWWLMSNQPLSCRNRKAV